MEEAQPALGHGFAHAGGQLRPDHAEPDFAW